MRTINELLIILRDNARVKKSWFGLKLRIDCGLCTEALNLVGANFRYITWDEYDIIMKHIANYGPTFLPNSGYRWPIGLWKPRLKWLNEQIELTKEV